MQFSMYNRVSSSYEVTHSRFRVNSDSKIVEDNLLIQVSINNPMIDKMLLTS